MNDIAITVKVIASESRETFTVSSGGSKRRGRGVSTAQIFFNFMQFLEKLAKPYVDAPEGWCPPPTGNPGSAPGFSCSTVEGKINSNVCPLIASNVGDLQK